MDVIEARETGCRMIMWMCVSVYAQFRCVCLVVYASAVVSVVHARVLKWVSVYV